MSQGFRIAVGCDVSQSRMYDLEQLALSPTACSGLSLFQITFPYVNVRVKGAKKLMITHDGSVATYTS